MFYVSVQPGRLFHPGPLLGTQEYTEMTEYQVPGCWLVTSVAVTSTSEAQSKHDEIQEKMAATRGAIKT